MTVIVEVRVVLSMFESGGNSGFREVDDGRVVHRHMAMTGATAADLMDREE